MNTLLTGGFPAVLAGACSISYVYFGFFIRPTAVKDKRFYPLVCYCFFAAVWCFCYVMFFLSIDPGIRERWQSFAYAGMSAMVFILWFVIRYTTFIRNQKISVIVFIVLWLPPLAAAYKSIAENGVARDFPFGFWYLFIQIQTTLYNLAAIILLIIYHRKQKTHKSKIQVSILCISGFVLVTLAWIADLFLGFNKSQDISAFWVLIWVGIVFYTIKKYRFSTITPEFISKDITETIEESILLLDPNLEVIFTNTAMRRMLNAGENYHFSLSDIVCEKHLLDKELSELAKSESTAFKIRITIIQLGSSISIPVDMKVKKVIDEFHDISGYLIVISRVKELEYFKSLYRITKRELDIIYQLATGMTARKIADFFKLTDRTVETHITNIYNKIGIKNRIELMNVLSEFDVPDLKNSNAQSEH